MTTATDLATLCGTGFTSPEQALAITTAQKYLGTSEGESDAKDMATAFFAHAILVNRRRAESSKTNDQLIILPMSSLVTNEIRALLAEDEKAKAYTIIHYKTPNANWRS